MRRVGKFDENGFGSKAQLRSAREQRAGGDCRFEG